ncbi:MAG: Sec-independent protein translocase protein TatB [Polyangiaceae bacterium]
MFGLGFGEMVLILIVGIVVVGPRQLPTLMRTAGKWVAKLRRMSTDLRSQSGIDDLIRQEGLEKEIQELRALSRVNVIDTLVSTATGATAARPRPAPRPQEPRPAPLPGTEPFRDREYPLLGCDHYEALADDVMPYPPEDEPEAASEGDAAPVDAPASTANAVAPGTSAPVGASSDAATAPATAGVAATGATGTGAGA